MIPYHHSAHIHRVLHRAVYFTRERDSIYQFALCFTYRSLPPKGTANEKQHFH